MKEMKDNMSRWRDIPCSWAERINIVKMTVLPNTIYRFVQSLSITNGIFHRTRTKNFTIHVETQKTPNNQSNLKKKRKKEKQNWNNQAV